MWFIALLISVLFGVWLAEKQTIESWILAFIVALILSWIFTVLLAALAPSLGITATVDLLTYAITTIAGLILGFVTAKIKATIIK